MQGNDKVWHREVMTPAVKRVAKELQRHSFLSRFYLAGGTGIALHFGHRRSVDLDFFSAELFDQEVLLQRLQQLSGFSLLAKDTYTLHVHIQKTRVSFLGYIYPLLFPFAPFLDFRVADARDIACMKISAIAARGTKRDFIDLFIVSKHYGLSHLLELFKKKFAQTRYNMVHVLKSLAYFDDAEKDPMPDVLVELSWKQVKEYFTAEVLRLM